MNFYISYFYQIRFMKPNQIPISTAAWDPKWFHKGYNKDKLYLDMNGVINGLRIELLNPNNLSKDYQCCPCELHKVLPPGSSCEFLDGYSKYLHKLDFNYVISELIRLSKLALKSYNLPEPKDIVLIVYETPDNPCSERRVLTSWFKENGVELKEWKYGKDL